MEFVLKKQPGRDICVSFVLIDWSCRESLHTLDYLNNQTIERDRYEILWIEYYQRRLPELVQRIDTARQAGVHPPVDVYAVLGMPDTVYYHKHLMYNVGILLAHGRIICICDSDAFMKPTFVESIIQAFEDDANIVLHHDQVRNNSRRFYPFNYPDVEDAVGMGCVNWVNGKPFGLSDPDDPLHTRNYGSCMCALRQDLIDIGGADMHIDYLGYICGPYEMTFRLVNKGKREVWHQSEWLYHVWHPGQAGDRNYAGPHDGMHLSTTALAVRTSGRIEPLVPHQAITRLRQGIEPAGEEEACLIDSDWMTEWDVRQVETKVQTFRQGNTLYGRADRKPGEPLALKKNSSLVTRPLGLSARLQLIPVLVGLFWRQFQVKRRAARLRFSPSADGILARAEEPARRFHALWGFVQRMMAYNRHLCRVCRVTLCYVASLDVDEVVLYGDPGGDAVRLLRAFAGFLNIRVRAVCPLDGADTNPKPRRTILDRKTYELWTQGQLAAYRGIVIVASFVNSAVHLEHLQKLGLRRNSLIVLE